jgi:Lrp/AsnC family transcriptional regulator, regulator for asnA, asnC and gidA
MAKGQGQGASAVKRAATSTRSGARSGRKSKRDESPAPFAGQLAAVDSLNREIILRLMDDGRASFSEIARELGVAEGTVRLRVAQMQRDNYLRFIAVVNPLALGYTAWAMIGVNLSPATDPGPVAEYFRDRPETIYVMRVAGRYDMLVEVICKTPTELLAFLDTHIHSWDAIASVEPLIGLGMYKSLLKWEGQPADVDAAPAAVFKETGK